MGASIDVIGDVNSDGYPDIVSGAPDHSIAGIGNNAGMAVIIDGRSGTILNSTFGASNGANYGYSVAAIEDINLDGIPDYISGAPYDFNVSMALTSGSATLISGKTNHTMRKLWGKNDSALFGRQVAGAGDLNGDGVPDFAVYSPGEITGANYGKVYIYSGKTGQVYQSMATNSHSIYMAGAGLDANQDGFADFILGDSSDATFGTDSGSVVVSSGKDFSTLWTAYGSAAGDQFGAIVRNLSDKDGDGIADVGVGLPGAAPYGSVFILSGASGSAMGAFASQDCTEIYGASFSETGDVNQDGIVDMAFGFAHGTCSNSIPHCKTFDGATGNIYYTMYDPSSTYTDTYFGANLSAAGDVNGDGIDDLLVCAPASKIGGFQAGAVLAITAIPSLMNYYTPGTPGCGGKQHMYALDNAIIGGNSFGFNITKCPPSSIGLLIAADHGNAAGFDPFGIGIIMFVDIPGSSDVIPIDISSDAAGSSQIAISIPNNPILQGESYYAQTFWSWPAPSCGVSPMQISSSNGIKMMLTY